MKKSKKSRESCQMSFYECVDRDRCSLRCKGPSQHPECEKILYCSVDGVNCNGNCEVHELNKQLQDKKLELNSISNALTEITFVHRLTKDEIEKLENKIKELS